MGRGPACGKETAMHKWYGILFFTVAVMVFAGAAAHAGQAKAEDSPLDAMSIEELRAYQSYFYAMGNRDPLTMRMPTDREKGLDSKTKAVKAPSFEEQESMMEGWLKDLTASLKIQDYDNAMKTAETALGVIDNEWPPIKPEHVKLIRMNDEIRSYQRMAIRLKSQQDIGKEFANLGLRVDGVVWSPTDAKAVVNGILLSAGEVMLKERKDGDLRVEMIEEHGVVFQFKGMRFRLPVEVYATKESGAARGRGN